VGAPQMEDAASGGEGVVLIDSQLRPDQFILQEADLGGDRRFRINGKIRQMTRKLGELVPDTDTELPPVK
jgi:hypothetical protein